MSGLFHRPTKAELLSVMQRHIGRSNGITAALVALELQCSERLVRALVTELREDGVAVCGHPSIGYFIGTTPEDIEQTCSFLRSRAMRSLVLESKLRGMPLADLVGQLHLKT